MSVMFGPGLISMSIQASNTEVRLILYLGMYCNFMTQYIYFASASYHQIVLCLTITTTVVRL